MGVELAGHAREPGATRVALAIEQCDPATTSVNVAVTNDAGAPGAQRDVGLEDIALEARPRALALAVAELVRGAAPAAPPPAPPAVAAAPPPAAPSFTTSVAADALLALFPQRGTTLWGGRLSATIDRGRLGLGLFAEGAAGEHGYAEGDVALQSFGAGVMAGPRWISGRLTLAPALVAALAWARIQGHAGEPGVTSGGGADLTAALRVRVAASVIFVRAVSVRVFLEGGWMARGFDATVDGARAAGISGATLDAGLGLGL